MTIKIANFLTTGTRSFSIKRLPLPPSFIYREHVTSSVNSTTVATFAMISIIDSISYIFQLDILKSVPAT